MILWLGLEVSVRVGKEFGVVFLYTLLLFYFFNVGRYRFVLKFMVRVVGG